MIPQTTAAEPPSGSKEPPSLCAMIHGTVIRLPYGAPSPSAALSAHVTFIRHAESTGNVAGLWQGHTDAPLSDNGRDQVARLAGRLARRPVFSRVVTSDLQRARVTAEAVGRAQADERWRELRLGEWEGLSIREIREQHPDVVEAIASGRDFSIPGGETSIDFYGRLTEAFDDLVSGLDDGDHVAVVSHGGVIQTIVAAVLGLSTGFPPIQLPTNTALTTIRLDGDRRQVAMYNDAAHVGSAVGVVRWSGTDVYLFRHGETDANVAERWQGRGDGQLTANGRAQALGLAETAPAMDRLFASPLSRARDTARAVAARHGHDVELRDDLVEIDFGAWEDKTAFEAETLDPEHFDLIYRQGQDLPRGRTGESFADSAERLARAIEEIVGSHAGQRIGLVTHGGAARAYVAGLVGIGFRGRHVLPVLRNTARARVVYTERGPLIAEYNVAPHLDDRSDG